MMNNTNFFGKKSNELPPFDKFIHSSFIILEPNQLTTKIIKQRDYLKEITEYYLKLFNKIYNTVLDNEFSTFIEQFIELIKRDESEKRKTLFNLVSDQNFDTLFELMLKLFDSNKIQTKIITKHDYELPKRLFLDLYKFEKDFNKNETKTLFVLKDLDINDNFNFNLILDKLLEFPKPKCSILLISNSSTVIDFVNVKNLSSTIVYNLKQPKAQFIYKKIVYFFVKDKDNLFLGDCNILKQILELVSKYSISLKGFKHYFQGSIISYFLKANWRNEFYHIYHPNFTDYSKQIENYISLENYKNNLIKTKQNFLQMYNVFESYFVKHFQNFNIYQFFVDFAHFSVNVNQDEINFKRAELVIEIIAMHTYINNPHISVADLVKNTFCPFLLDFWDDFIPTIFENENAYKKFLKQLNYSINYVTHGFGPIYDKMIDSLPTRIKNMLPKANNEENLPPSFDKSFIQNFKNFLVVYMELLDNCFYYPRCYLIANKSINGLNFLNVSMPFSVINSFLDYKGENMIILLLQSLFQALGQIKLNFRLIELYISFLEYSESIVLDETLKMLIFKRFVHEIYFSGFIQKDSSKNNRFIKNVFSVSSYYLK